MLRRLANAPRARYTLGRHDLCRRASSSKAHTTLTWQDVEEPLDVYKERGYMPLSIGEYLGEYRVVRKLGWGNYSTVWLVQRERCVYLSSSLRACSYFAGINALLL